MDWLRLEARRSVTLACMLLCTLMLAVVAERLLHAQEDAAGLLIEREPFDQITLNESNQSRVLQVLPLPFEGRKLPAEAERKGRLRVRLLREPEKQFEISWRDIGEVVLFEQLVLQEAQQLTAAGRFDEAFRNFAWLKRRRPETEGLEESLQNYLYINSGNLFGEQKYAQAMGVLEELYQRNSDYRHPGGQSVVQALDRVAERLLTGYVEDGQYLAARQLLARLQEQYGEQGLAAIDQVRQQLVQRAAAKRDEIRRLLDAGEFLAAHQVSREMMMIWPQLEDGRDVALQAARRYPVVVVGVQQLAAQSASAGMHDHAARRTARLLQRTLVEFLGPGPEGGRYGSPWGTVERSEDRTELQFQLHGGSPDSGSLHADAYEVSQRLLNLASPSGAVYRPDWAGLLDRVVVEGVYGVQAVLRRPHVLPEAMLEVPLQDEATRSGPYEVAEEEEQQVRFRASRRLRQQTATPIAEIIERRFEEPRSAIRALRDGEVDVLDHVPAADVGQLRNDSAIQVGQYAMPVLHVLVPNTENPYMANRTFRRALLYGIDRAAILNQIVLRGRSVPGCRVISGPFPAGVDLGDALAYAYDERIEPRAYSPRLGTTLVHLAEKELVSMAEQRGTDVPPRRALVLGFPDTETPRLVCQAIAAYLEVIGVPCQLQPFPPGVTQDTDGDCDLTYVELAMYEPIVDARRAFAPGGVAGSDNPYIDLALRQIETAGNWREARERLQELHRITHSEVNVIPLWQMIEFYAHRRELRGLNAEPVTLYQDIERWTIEPRVAVQ